MEEEKIKGKMQDLASLIAYEYSDISWLSQAMNCTKINRAQDGRNRDNCVCKALSTLGDAVLKLILADFCYSQNADCKSITLEKSKTEKNKTLHKVCIDSGIIGFAYNEKHFNDEPNIPDHEKPKTTGHDLYVESIIGAIYKDRGFEYAKNWTVEFLKKYNALTADA